MKQDTKEAKKLSELLAQAEDHPMMKAILAEKAGEVLKMRKEAAGKIEALRKGQGEVIPRLQAELAGKEEKYKRAKAALDAIEDEIRSSRLALCSERNSFDSDIKNQEAVLFETSDPLINETITFFQNRREALFVKSVDTDRYKGETNIFKMTKNLITFSNARSIASALTYCLACIRELEGMKLAPTLDVARIAELKQNIPDVSVMEEITADKPLPRINTNPPMKSDSQLTWELGKINEKFMKWLIGK